MIYCISEVKNKLPHQDLIERANHNKILNILSYSIKEVRSAELFWW